MEQARNHLALLSRDELAAGLALLTSQSRAEEIAAAVYAIPAAEQVFYDWIETSLILASCASPSVADRVVRYVGVTPEARADFEQRRDEICEWCRPRGERPDAFLTIEDVVYDGRNDEDPVPPSR